MFRVGKQKKKCKDFIPHIQFKSSNDLYNLQERKKEIIKTIQWFQTVLETCISSIPIS